MTRTFAPEEAVERYLKERKQNSADSTLYNHRSTLRNFLEFCNLNGIERIEDVDPFFISDYRLDRAEEVSDTTVYNDLSTIRVFIRWCESRELLDRDIAENMTLPDVDDASRDTTINPERAEQILSYLEKYEYATLRHALFALLYDTGIRIGSARSLNVTEFDRENKYIKLTHNPDEDTPLKNQEGGEREVNISEDTVEILSDYIDARRNKVTDDYGNKPLFSSSQGRAHRTTLRKHIVALTRPCYYSNECPHDREINGCEATAYDSASKCPSSVSPHPVRRSAITAWLDDGYSKELLSDRMDVSVEVLEEHYDARSEEQKRELRREMLDIE
jgi:site-specific recombinase XerD